MCCYSQSRNPRWPVPALFGADRPIKNRHDLNEYRILHEGDRFAWNHWCTIAGINDFEPNQEWILDDPALMIEAAIRGQGIGMGAFPLIDSLIVEGKLIRLFDEGFTADRKYFLVEPKNRSTSNATRTFFSWVKSAAIKPAAED